MKPLLLVILVLISCKGLSQPCGNQVNIGFAPSGNYCESEPVYLFVNTITGATYSWQTPMGVINTQNIYIDSVVYATHAGKYIVTVTVDSCVYKDTSYVYPQWKPYPPVFLINFQLHNDTITYCEGDTLYILPIGSGIEMDYRIWDPFGNVFTHDIYKVADLASNGIYKVVAVPGSGCISDTTYMNLTITPSSIKPKVVVTDSSEGAIYTPIKFTAFVTDGGSNPYYQWLKNGADIPGAMKSNYICILGTDLLQGDEVSVRVRADTLPCPGVVVSDTILINIGLEVSELSSAGTIQLYPNPNNGSFSLVINNGRVTDGTLEIINTIGQVVYKENVRLSNVLDLDLRNVLADGVYLLKIQGDDKTMHARFIVKH